jgi:hypothetical protein
LSSLNKNSFTCLTDIFSLVINRRSRYFCWQLMRLYFYGRPLPMSLSSKYYYKSSKLNQLLIPA